MSTTSQVRAVWEAAIFNSNTVRGWGTRCHFYEPTDDGGEYENARRYAGGRIDYLVVLVRRSSDPRLVGGTAYAFEVEAQLTLQQSDQEGETLTAVSDRLDALDDLVQSALGPTWGGTVDYYDGGQAAGPAPAAVDGKRCWRGSLRYRGVQTV